MIGIRLKNMRYGRAILFLHALISVLILLSGVGCKDNAVRHAVPVVLLDFEHDSQLDMLSWKCGTVYQRVRAHQSGGNYSLMVEMYPGVEWPGLGMEVQDGWQGYGELCLHTFNPLDKPLAMSYRIDDRKDNPPYADRANGSIVISPGAGTITLDLTHMKTSGTDRLLDLDRACRFLMFLHRPDQRVTLFLDDITLR